MRLPKFKFPKFALRILLGLAATALLSANTLHFVDIGLIDRLELFSYDARVKLTMPGGQDSRIIIVDLDEKSQAEIGRWPWGRDQMAHLVDVLFDRHQIAVVEIRPAHISDIGCCALVAPKRPVADRNKLLLQALSLLSNAAR